MMNDEAVPEQKLQTGEESPSPERPPGKRPTVLGRALVMVAIAAATATGGFSAAWLMQQQTVPQPAQSSDTLQKPSLPAVPIGAELADFVPQPGDPLPANPRDLIDETKTMIEQLLAAYPNDLDCLEMKARTQDWLGKSAEAVETWRQCLKLNPAYTHAYVGMAAVAAKKGDHEKAAELARQAVATNPASFRAREILAEALINLRKADEAVEVLDEFLRRDPRAHGYFLLGSAHTQLQQHEKARKAYEAAVKKYPRYAEAYYALSRSYLRLGLREEARRTMAKYWELMKQRGPSRPGMGSPIDDFTHMCTNAAILYTDAARIYYARGEPRRAELLWRRATALDKNNLPARQMLVAMYRREGRLWEAAQCLEELAAVDAHDPRYWLEVGQMYATALRFEDAERSFRQACSAAPDRADGYAALVRLYLTANRKLPQAVPAARNAVEREPSADNYALLAAACRRTGDRAGALAAMEQAIKLAPKNADYQKMYRALRAEQ